MKAWSGTMVNGNGRQRQRQRTMVISKMQSFRFSNGVKLIL
jgi:hypothetical protein